MRLSLRLSQLQSVIVLQAAIGLFAICAIVPTSWTARGIAGELATITVLQPRIGTVLRWLPVVTALSLLTASGVGIWRPIVRYPVAAFLLGVFGLPVACLLHSVGNLAPWTMHGRATTADGVSYVFCNSSFLQGRTMAIARLDESGLFVQRLTVLVTHSGDSTRNWASIVRPAYPTEQYGQLHLAPKDILVGVWYRNRCYLAYDVRTKRPIGHGAIERISPFVCLGPDSNLHAPDVVATMGEMERTIRLLDGCDGIPRAGRFLSGAPFTGYPSPASLQRGLTHENARVREAAGRLISVHSQGLDRICSRVLEHVAELRAQLTCEDVGGRRKAAMALGRIGSPGADWAIAALTKAASTDTDDQTRGQAAQSLGLIGPAAIPALIRLTRHSDPAVRSAALGGLQTAGSAAKTPEAISALQAACHDADEQVRSRAQRFVEKIRRSPK